MERLSCSAALNGSQLPPPGFAILASSLHPLPLRAPTQNDFFN